MGNCIKRELGIEFYINESEGKNRSITTILDRIKRMKGSRRITKNLFSFKDENFMTKLNSCEILDAKTINNNN